MLQSFLSIFLDSTVTALTASSNVIGREKKKGKELVVIFDLIFTTYYIHLVPEALLRPAGTIFLDAKCR
jgi:hypothetical protein